MLVPAAPESVGKPGKDAIHESLRVREVRKVIDPEWQLRDVDSALQFLLGAVAGVDTARVGIWGSSFGGGHDWHGNRRIDRLPGWRQWRGRVQTDRRLGLAPFCRADQPQSGYRRAHDAFGAGCRHHADRHGR